MGLAVLLHKSQIHSFVSIAILYSIQFVPLHGASGVLLQKPVGKVLLMMLLQYRYYNYFKIGYDSFVITNIDCYYEFYRIKRHSKL